LFQKEETVELFDAHAHTNFSYCATSDLTCEVYRSVLDDIHSILGRQAITNHGFQAYFPENIAWSWEFLDDFRLFDRYRSWGDERILGFREKLESMKDDRFVFGLEVELMGDGRLTVSDAVRGELEILLGSLHVLPRAYGEDESLDAETLDAAVRACIAYTRDLMLSGVDVIAHPFRWLAHATGAVPREAVVEVVRLAAEHNVALELNLRGPRLSTLTFITEAVAAKVPLALATDAHQPAEVGDLEEHLRLIRTAGFDPAQIPILDGAPRKDATER